MSDNTNIHEGYIKKETMWLIVLVALAFGFLAGIVFSIYKASPSVPVQQQAAQQTTDSSSLDPETTRVILALEKEVAANPNNTEAWIHLGNHYFDTENFPKAIEAYKKSLALDPNNADVLTDLGVMYRRNGNAHEAIASFDKAISISPDHATARFNRGIVQLYDLQDKEGAIKTWEELVKIHPDAKAPSGEPISEIIKKLKAKK